MSAFDARHRPLVCAVSSSARQLFMLLRCISFASKAQVQISKEGLRFSVEDARVMGGYAFLSKDLFTSFQYNPIVQDHAADDEMDVEVDQETPAFQISLPALLETLQIFGLNSAQERYRDPYSSGVSLSFARGGPDAAFSNRVLGMTGICRLSYHSPGDPFCIILEEAGVTTTCELVTYEPESNEDIPFDRDALASKIIMRASWLHDAISELSSTSPTRLTIAASPTAPFFALSAAGPLGSATVEFSNDAQLLETFHVPRRTFNTYKFSQVKAAARAMAIATKVSIRGDRQGVLSLQFMIETENGGVSFVDYRFIPFTPEDGDEGEDASQRDDESTDEE